MRIQWSSWNRSNMMGVATIVPKFWQERIGKPVSEVCACGCDPRLRRMFKA